MTTIYDQLTAKAAEWPHRYWPHTYKCTPLCEHCQLEALAKQVCAEADLKLSHLVDEVLRERMEVPTLCVLIESDIIGGPQ